MLWRDIECYEGHYQVSNIGTVRSIDRTDIQGKFRKGQDMKTRSAKNGYIRVSLRKDGTKKIFNVHRLVAKAFIENTKGKPFVNHKDENKANNNVDNLEWCDHLYNIRYGTGLLRRIKSQTNDHNRSTKIFSINVVSGLITFFASIREADRQGFNRRSINRCLKDKDKVFSNCVWRCI